ncbi:MAG: hypothetical protein IKO54_03715 [Lachnospiraceae bacterium]|nr:hypothetical protein [Lachnospiraceae bacterium]MBR4541250.1 hypothetical protein [Lachnospiraceae bacterium]
MMRKKTFSVCMLLILALGFSSTNVFAETTSALPYPITWIGNGVSLSEIYDGTEIVFDQDDFKSLDAYNKYLEKKGQSDIEESYSEDNISGEKTGDVTANALYKASLGTKNNAIQSFYINGSEIYICQNYNNITYNGVAYSGNNVLLSRCIISGNTFSRVDDMLLTDVGHGQTLDMYTYGNNNYFLISCGGYQTTTPDGNLVYWSTQIGRIQYSANTVINNSNIKRLVDLNYANMNNTSFGAVKRVDAALSSDKTKLLIWKRSQSNVDEFSVYDFSVINTELSGLNNTNTLSFQANTTLQNACTSTVTQPSNMPSSVQGVELSNAGGGIHSIYVSSGNEKKGIPLKIFRFNTNGNYKNQATIIDTGVWSLYNASPSLDVLAEIECIKISGNNLQFVLRNTDNSSQQVIAYIAKSYLS